MWELAAREDDVVGCRQTFTQPEMATGLKDVLGITLRINKDTGIVQYWLTDKVTEVFYPSGAVFKIKRDLFWKVAGFCELFINGGEDQDLFLKCIKAGAKISFCPIPITHHLSQSDGRFKYCSENDALLKERWPDEYLKKAFKLC
jgi:GT2 family glycosyltransferase